MVAYEAHDIVEQQMLIWIKVSTIPAEELVLQLKVARQKSSSIVGLTALRLAFFMGYE